MSGVWILNIICAAVVLALSTWAYFGARKRTPEQFRTSYLRKAEVSRMPRPLFWLRENWPFVLGPVAAWLFLRLMLGGAIPD